MWKSCDFWVNVVLVFICLLLVTMAYAIADTAQGHVRPELGTPTHTPPTIPSCDKELWLRIKDGCDNEADN